MNFQELKKYLPKLEQGVFLKDHTSFKIGGPAKFFYPAQSKKDLIKALEIAKKFNVPVFVLGGGSNLLVSDKGFDGLVIKTGNTGLECNQKTIVVESGTNLGQLIVFSLNHGLTGLEWGSGIPGTVGGAIRGNAGAFGSDISKSIKSVEVLDLNNMQTKSLNSKGCEFGYRESIFKKNSDLVILSAQVELETGNKEQSQEMIKKYLIARKTGYSQFPSAGCVFKNKKVESENKQIFKKFSELEQFSKKGALPAGALIDQCGLKGKQIGGAKIADDHANFIINIDNAKADHVFELIKLVQKSVKEKYDLDLELEIQLLAF